MRQSSGTELTGEGSLGEGGPQCWPLTFKADSQIRSGLQGKIMDAPQIRRRYRRFGKMANF